MIYNETTLTFSGPRLVSVTAAASPTTTLTATYASLGTAQEAIVLRSEYLSVVVCFRVADSSSYYLQHESQSEKEIKQSFYFRLVGCLVVLYCWYVAIQVLTVSRFLPIMVPLGSTQTPPPPQQ